MQYVWGVLYIKNNISFLLLGLYHASVFKSNNPPPPPPQNVLHYGIVQVVNYWLFTIYQKNLEISVGM